VLLLVLKAEQYGVVFVAGKKECRFAGADGALRRRR
jgi:hypothetical protein